jgi:hypothetical protein
MDHEQTSGCAYKPPEQLTQRTTEPGTAHAAVVDDRWASKLDSQRGGLKLRDEEADCRWQSVSCDTGEGASLHQQKLQQQAASISTDEQQRQQQGVAAAAAAGSSGSSSTLISQEIRRECLPLEPQTTQQVREGSCHARPPGRRPPDTKDTPLQQQPQRRSLEPQLVHAPSVSADEMVLPSSCCSAAAKELVAPAGGAHVHHLRQQQQHLPQQVASEQWRGRCMMLRHKFSSLAGKWQK